MTELDASINNCRRLNDTLFLITYSLSTSICVVSAVSKQIHSTVARYYFKAQELQVVNVDSKKINQNFLFIINNLRPVNGGVLRHKR